MNRNLLFISTLGVGLMTAAGMAQAPAAEPAAPAAPAVAPASAPPQAIPAKIALVAFEQAVFATNEGQKAVLDVQKKFEPQKAKIDGLQTEIDSLKKGLEGSSATLSDAERTARMKAVDTKEKQLTRDAENAQTAYNSDLQEAYAKVAQKFSTTLKNYVLQNGYTLLLDVSNQQSAVMWAGNGNTDVTEAVVQAYNASSGVTAPPPAAPSASRPKPAAGGSTAPKPAAPRPAAPK